MTKEKEALLQIQRLLVRFVKQFPDFRGSPAFQCLLIDLNVYLTYGLVEACADGNQK